MNSDLNLLLRLRDVHPPPDPGWWPPAPGWWLAFIIVVAFSYVGVRHGPSWWRRQRNRRALLKTFEQVAAAHRAGQSEVDLVPELTALIRHAATLRFPEQEPAALTGTAWVEFLERVAYLQGHFDGFGPLLTETPYQAHGSGPDVSLFLGRCREWLRTVL